MVNPKIEPLGADITGMVAILFRLILIDISLGILFITFHFAGVSLPLLVFVGILVFWIGHLPKIRVALSYIGEPLRTFRRLVGNWEWSKTPYDQVISKPKLGWSKPCQPKKRFDLFVSYRSLDIEVVRPVVDMLIASGLTVWFAEYTFILNNQDEWKDSNEEKWQDDAIKGIHQSKYGLIFTNDKFIESNPCRFELEHLARICGYERMLEVRIRDEPKTRETYPDLKESLSTDTPEPRGILEFIQSKTSLSFRIPPAMNVSSDGEELLYKDARLGYTINVINWKRHKNNSVGLKSNQKGGQAVQGKFNIEPGRIPSPVFRRNLGGHRCELQLSAGALNPKLRTAPTTVEEVEDTRLYYQFLHYARVKLELNILYCTGLHFLFLNETRHRILSYWDRRFWVREYFVSLPRPQSGEFKEFDIIFRYWGPFTLYCRYTQLMDELVKTLKWE